MNMITKVARSLNLDPSDAEHRNMAKAAIKAMREPTDAMCIAGQAFMESEIGSSATLQGCSYMEMIDAALKEE
jgi:hypothetical protein